MIRSAYVNGSAITIPVGAVVVTGYDQWAAFYDADRPRKKVRGKRRKARRWARMVREYLAEGMLLP